MDLPSDMFYTIFNNLKCQDMKSVRLVCHQFDRQFYLWLNDNIFEFGTVYNFVTYEQYELLIFERLSDPQPVPVCHYTEMKIPPFIVPFIQVLKHVKFSKIDHVSLQIFSHCKSINVGSSNFYKDDLNSIKDCKRFVSKGLILTKKHDYFYFEVLKIMYFPSIFYNGILFLSVCCIDTLKH